MKYLLFKTAMNPDCHLISCTCDDALCPLYHMAKGEIHACGRISCEHNFPKEFHRLADKCYTRRCPIRDCRSTDPEHLKTFAHNSRCMHGAKQGQHSKCRVMKYYVILKAIAYRYSGISISVRCTIPDCRMVYMATVNSKMKDLLFNCPLLHDIEPYAYLPCYMEFYKQFYNRRPSRLYIGHRDEACDLRLPVEEGGLFVNEIHAKAVTMGLSFASHFYHRNDEGKVVQKFTPYVYSRHDSPVVLEELEFSTEEMHRC